MATFDLNIFNAVLQDLSQPESGVDYSGKSLKLDSEKDAQPIVDAINKCQNLGYLTLTGNTLGVKAALAIAKALEAHPELKVARFSDMFTGRMKTEIPPALSALGDGMITAGARLTVLDLSDNAFGPIGVEGLARLLQSDVCGELEELRLNNNGLGVTGGRLLATALAQRRRRLRIFIAGRNRLENDGAKALAEVFKEMGTLEEVAMPQNGIYHVGISALSQAFKCNPGLISINLNDNTIGSKGAEAIANVLPSLKNLKSINFGDCLLKSKGALALAKAFRDNSILLESLDLSHNEIGRDACMEVVEAITVLPDSSERLSRVVLAGNSLGDAGNVKKMKDKLGASAELSDGEGSDNEYVTDSEEEDDEENDSVEILDTSGAGNNEVLEVTEDYAVESCSNVNVISLDASGTTEIISDVERFLKEPTIENLKRLGEEAADVIDAHIQSIGDTTHLVQAYVEATLSTSGLSKQSELALNVSQHLYRRMVCHPLLHYSWPLTDALLAGLDLMKSEQKDLKIKWALPSCFYTLATVIDEPYFPAGMRNTLRFFIENKLSAMSESIQDEILKHPMLYY